MANGVLLKKKQNKRHEKKSPLGISRGAVRCILQWVPSIAPKKQDGPFGPIGVVGQETWRALLAETQRLLFMLLVSLSVLLIDARSMYVSILIFLFLSPFPSLPPQAHGSIRLYPGLDYLPKLFCLGGERRKFCWVGA